ncbi:MAG: hypothetical protein AAF346_18265 [Pseudomonadota bacterium]
MSSSSNSTNTGHDYAADSAASRVRTTISSDKTEKNLLAQDFADVREHEGHAVFRQVSDPVRKKFELHTPFLTLRPSGSFLPYILDRKIGTFDKRAIERLGGKS